MIDTVKWTCRKFNSFKFQLFSIFMNDDIECLEVLIVQTRFCHLQKNSPVMVFLHINKSKINPKLQEKALARWDLLIYHVSTISCVSLRSQSFVCNDFISCNGRFKVTKKSSPHMFWIYQNKLTRAPVIKIQVI